MKTLALALIGTGRWGKNIQRTLADLPGVRLAAAASLDWRALDWRALLNRQDLDGVLIATPAATHAALALPFLRKGIPLFIEKPLTASLKSATRLSSTAKRFRVPVMVGHIHLYNPAYAAAKRAAKRAGRIRYLLGEGMNKGPIRDDVSCLWDWAPHDLALTLDLLGQQPLAVQAAGHALLRPRTRLYDVATLSLQFPGGTRFVGIYSWLAPAKRKRLTIVGERLSVVFDDTAEKKVMVSAPNGRVSHPPYAKTPPLTNELRAFVAMLRTRKPPRTDLAQGLAVVRILEAAERSIARNGRAVRL